MLRVPRDPPPPHFVRGMTEHTTSNHPSASYYSKEPLACLTTRREAPAGPLTGWTPRPLDSQPQPTPLMPDLLVNFRYQSMFAPQVTQMPVITQQRQRCLFHHPLDTRQLWMDPLLSIHHLQSAFHTCAQIIPVSTTCRQKSNTKVNP